MASADFVSAKVSELWRFPVKSLGGGRVDEVRIDARGVHADRLWALRDLENGVTVSARRVPALLGCSARYEAQPEPTAGPGNVPPVIITFPDGSELRSGDAGIDDRLSEVAGRAVRLTPLPPANDTSQHRLSLKQSMANYAAAEVRRDFGLADDEPLIDSSVFTTKQMLTLTRFSTPPGTFVDLSPVHLLSTNSLAALSRDGQPYDVRRFRPNVLVAVANDSVAQDATAQVAEFPESAWVGAEVTIGTATLQVSIPTIRCVVPTRPQPGVDLDRALTRVLAERTDRFLGVYADVRQAGLVRVGDTVHVTRAPEPGVVRRAGKAVSKATLRGMQRVLEATVLRER